MKILVIKGERLLNEPHPGIFLESDYKILKTAQEVFQFIQDNPYIVFILGNVNDDQVAIICQSLEDRKIIAAELLKDIVLHGQNPLLPVQLREI